MGRCLLNRPEMEQRSVERTFWERDSRWHDVEAGVSLARPGKEGHVAGVLWARERDGNEVR